MAESPIVPGSGNAVAVATVQLSVASENVKVVSFNTTSGTATAGSDFTQVSGNLTFNKYETAKVRSQLTTGACPAQPPDGGGCMRAVVFVDRGHWQREPRRGP